MYSQIWNADQMGLHLGIISGRTLTISGTKKKVCNFQRSDAKTHSYIVHIQLNAAGKLPKKLPIILCAPGQMQKKARRDTENYPNLHIHWSTSIPKGTETATKWMNEVFLDIVEENSVLLIDAWTGYEQMLQLPQIKAKKLEIIQLPAGTASKLQPADVYFNRQFKSMIRRICTRVRWQEHDFEWSKEENFPPLMDMLWYQFTAPRFSGRFLCFIEIV